MLSNTKFSGLFGALILSAGVAHAGTITWDAVQNATGTSSDVINAGTLVAAASLYSGTDISLGGTTFNRVASFTGGTLSFANTSNLTVTNVASSGAGPATAPGGWNTSYNALVSGGAYSTQTNARLTFNITGLTIGQSYLIELWTPYWNANYYTAFTDGTSQSGSLSDGIGNGASQYVVGHFTAGTTTETITSIGTSQFPFIALAAAVQVRTDSAPVPEPESVFLLGVGLAGLLMRKPRTINKHGR